MNPLLNQDAFNAAKKSIIGYIKCRFRLCTDIIEDIAVDALLATWQYEKKKGLTVPFMAFAKMVANCRATDELRRQYTLRKQGVTFWDESLATELPAYTEGVGFSEEAEILINKAMALSKNLNANSQKLFDGDYFDSTIMNVKDAEKAAKLNIPYAGIRTRRHEIKMFMQEQLRDTPEYISLARKRA